MINVGIDCVWPGLVRRQWKGSDVHPSSSPPTLTWSRSLWSQSDSRRTGHWLNSRKTSRRCVMSVSGIIHLESKRNKVREVKISLFFPSGILSCKADLKGATPVPGPTMITGVSFSLGNFIVPFFTHRGTYTSSVTPFSMTHKQNDYNHCFVSGGTYSPSY